MGHIPQLKEIAAAIQLISQIKNPYDVATLDYDDGLYQIAQHAAFEVAKAMVIITLKEHASSS